MAHIIADRVQETSATTGTGTLTLAGAVTGFQAFSAVMANGDTIYYTITDQTASANWEVGVGTWGTGGTLARTTILASSTGSAVNFTSGALYVFGTYPASRAVYVDNSGVVTSSGTVPLSEGGTGKTTAPAANAELTGFTTTATAGGTTTLTNASSYYQVFTGTSAQTIQLPATSTLAQGWSYHLVNNSTGTITLRTSTAVTLGTIPPGITVMATAQTTSGNTATDWEFGYTDFSAITGTGSAMLNTSPTLAAGTAAAGGAPLKFTSGTNLSAVEAGAIEYDGEVFYSTPNTASGRGYAPSTQIFRLTANGGLITTIANFFGANSAINLAAGGEYEIEAFCYFLKTTAGTVTVTATTSLAPANLSGVIQTGAIAGGTAAGVAQQIALFNSTATGAAFAPTGSLTNGANHVMRIALIVEANASASNLRINFTSNAGSITPLRNSYYKVTRLPAGNSGSFAA